MKLEKPEKVEYANNWVVYSTATQNRIRSGNLTAKLPVDSVDCVSFDGMNYHVFMHPVFILIRIGESEMCIVGCLGCSADEDAILIGLKPDDPMLVGISHSIVSTKDLGVTGEPVATNPKYSPVGGQVKPKVPDKLKEMFDLAVDNHIRQRSSRSLSLLVDIGWDIKKIDPDWVMPNLDERMKAKEGLEDRSIDGTKDDKTLAQRLKETEEYLRKEKEKQLKGVHWFESNGKRYIDFSRTIQEMKEKQKPEKRIMKKIIWSAEDVARKRLMEEEEKERINSKTGD